MKEPNHEAKLKELSDVGSWQRAEAIEKGGWDKMPGQDKGGYAVAGTTLFSLESTWMLTAVSSFAMSSKGTACPIPH
jgi:hypothetical protein